MAVPDRGLAGVSDSHVTVIKVGGSLFDWPELPARWAELLASRRPSMSRSASP